MIRVLIADDHALIRVGMQQIVKEQAPFMEVAEAANGQEVLDMINAGPWDCLVLDISMPRRSGPVAARLNASISSRAARIASRATCMPS